MISSEKFKNKVEKWAEKFGVESKEIHLRKMKRKWASCSSKGRLTFEKFLLNEYKEERDKIVLHELLHLRYSNHGKMFNRLLDAYLKNDLSKIKTKF